MDYDSLTLLDLKTMCKERGLRVSGNKAEVVIRLMEDDESKSPQPAPSPQQNVQHMQQQMYGGHQPQIFITNNTTNVVGIAYIFGGILSVQGYRLGLQITLITLVISGMLSFAYHDEVSPLSVGMGGIWPVELSLVCSGFCILVVAMPLFTAAPSNFREGTPNYLRTVVDMVDVVSPVPLDWGDGKNEDIDV